MKWKSRMFIYMVLLLLGTACTLKYDKWLQKMQIFNQEHLDVSIPEFDHRLISFKTDLKATDIQLKFERGSVRNYLTKNEAIEEVANLFDQLEYNYGMYTYYGKQQFDEAKAQILNQIMSFNNRIEASNMENLYRQALFFIKDQHFLIGKKALYEKVAIYYNDTILLEKKGVEYFLKVANERVLKIESDQTEISLTNHVKRVINDEGVINYQIVVTGKKPDMLTLQLENNVIMDVPLKQYVETHINQYESFAYDWIDSGRIPILRIDEFRDINDHKMTAMIQGVSKIKNSSILFLDLRNNRGGFGFTASRLLEQLIGRMPASKGIQIQKLSMFKENLNQSNYEKNGFDTSQQDFWIKYPQKELDKNDRILIVLMNRNTSSAAEGVIDSLHSLENTVFVGVNSSGMIASSASFPILTLYSEVSILYGSNIRLYDDSYFKEYRGFEPDIYYFGNKNLETLILAFLNV